MSDPPAACRICGGGVIPGFVALPVVGAAKFAYRLPGAPAIETEIDATMCAKCGAIEFTARNRDRIRTAHEADTRARKARLSR